MTPDDDDLTPDPQTAADDAADDAHTERWREERARGREGGFQVINEARLMSVSVDTVPGPYSRGEVVLHDAMCPDVGHGCHPVVRCQLCQCDLIARVRADERERAAGRVRDCDTWLVDYHGRRAVWLGDVLAAIREGGA